MPRQPKNNCGFAENAGRRGFTAREGEANHAL
jgi:hypothetical protein